MKLDLLAFAAWASVVVGAGTSLAALDEMARAPSELARAAVLVGLLIALAGGAACVLLARGRVL